MRKIIFWDNRDPVYIQDEQEAGVISANTTKQNGFILNHLSGKDWCAKGTIARITKASYQEYQHLLPQTNRLDAPKKVEVKQTPEQIAKTEKLKQNIRDMLHKKGLSK